jgi:hypothetical protein
VRFAVVYPPLLVQAASRHDGRRTARAVLQVNDLEVELEIDPTPQRQSILFAHRDTRAQAWQ